MKKNMLVLMLVAVMIIGVASPVKACGEVCDTPPQDISIPDCKINPMNPIVEAPAKLIFDGSMSNAYEYVWKMDNNVGFDSNFGFMFEFPGTYDLKLMVFDKNGNWNACKTSIVVKPSEIITIPTPEPVVTPVSNQTSMSRNTNITETNETTVSGNIEGDGNFAPVINGNGNTITFTTSDSHNTDIDDHPDQSVENNTTEAEVEPETIKTTPKSFFWQLVKSILEYFVGPANSWIQWIVINK